MTMKLAGLVLGVLQVMAAGAAQASVTLDTTERVFSFDFSTATSPPPPYAAISWTAVFEASDPIAAGDSIITNVYGGLNGSELIQVRNDTAQIISAGGTTYGPSTTANPIFNPMLDGVFSLGLRMDSGSARLLSVSTCGIVYSPAFSQTCKTTTPGQVASANVVVGGKEWRQPKETVGLTWNQLNAACSAGPCSGSVNGIDLDGWTWASVADVQALFEGLILPGSVQFPTVFTRYLVPNSPGIQAALLPPLFEPIAVLPGVAREIDAFSRSLAGGIAHTPQLIDFVDGRDDVADLGNFRSVSQSYSFIGAWLYRSDSLIDQVNDVQPTLGYSFFSRAGNPPRFLGQTFTAGATGLLTSVELALWRQPDFATGVSVLVADSAGQALGSVVVPMADIPTAVDAFPPAGAPRFSVRVDLSSAAIPVAEGGTYVIWLSSTATVPVGVGGNFLNALGDGNTYSGGTDVFVFGAPSLGNSGTFGGDLLFRTYVRRATAVDTDQDGVDDGIDNCPLVSNADQRDRDGDSSGDVCDLDMDGDGVPNAIDNCPARANADQTDSNGDGFGDVCVDPSVTIPSSAVIDPAAQIGSNSIVNKGVRVGADSTLGSSVIVNKNVVIATNVSVGDQVFIDQGAALLSGVTVGAGTRIGQYAVICSGAHLGRDVTIGKYVLIQTNVVVPDGAIYPAWAAPASPAACNAP